MMMSFLNTQSCLCDEYMYNEVSLVPRPSRLQFMIVCSRRKLEVGAIKNWGRKVWEQGCVEAVHYFNQADGD